jgi:hypothetical protein
MKLRVMLLAFEYPNYEDRITFTSHFFIKYMWSLCSDYIEYPHFLQYHVTNLNNIPRRKDLQPGIPRGANGNRPEGTRRSLKRSCLLYSKRQNEIRNWWVHQSLEAASPSNSQLSSPIYHLLIEE